jgi:hypothetical protein
MLTRYPEGNTRRSVFAVLLFLSVLGPAVLATLTIKNVRAQPIEVLSFFAGLLGIPLLCIWCAVYIRQEPRRVQIALIWIAVLFLFLLCQVVTHPYVY